MAKDIVSWVSIVSVDNAVLINLFFFFFFFFFLIEVVNITLVTLDSVVNIAYCACDILYLQISSCIKCQKMQMIKTITPEFHPIKVSDR